MALVDRELVMRALRIEDEEDADNVTLKIQQAEDIVLDYVQPKPEPAWTSDTVPARVTAAIILIVGYLHDNSPEGQEAIAGLTGEAATKPSPLVALLKRLRTPSLA